MPAFPMGDMHPEATSSEDMEHDDDVESAAPMQLEFRSSRAHSEPESARPETRAAKYHKSRIFGQTHRNNERKQEERLTEDIHRLREENNMLLRIMARSGMAEDWRTEPGSIYRPLREGAAEEYRLSARAANMLGSHTATGAVCLALLEIIALRRNVIGGPRRRAAGRKAPNVASLEAACRRVNQRCVDEFEGYAEDGRLYASQKLRQLSEMHRNWSDREGAGDVFTGSDEEEIEVTASDDELTVRRRRKGCGPRRCTRCKKIKNAGSGHGRSNCDDGVSVSLDIPYPAPPGWRLQYMNGTRNENS